MSVDPLRKVALGMTFTQEELARLHAKAAENGLELDEYVNHVIRQMLDETRRRDDV